MGRRKEESNNEEKPSRYQDCATPSLSLYQNYLLMKIPCLYVKYALKMLLLSSLISINTNPLVADLYENQ